jgi:hypothetical protein
MAENWVATTAARKAGMMEPTTAAPKAVQRDMSWAAWMAEH